MTSKKLDRKFMSCFWGLVRLFPLFVLFTMLGMCLLQFTADFYEFGPSNFVDVLANTLGELLTAENGEFDWIFERLPFIMLPNFMSNWYLDFINYFGYDYYGFFL